MSIFFHAKGHAGDPMPEREPHHKGRDVHLVFHKDSASVLSETGSYKEVILLTNAAKVIRNHMLDHTSIFNGNLQERCDELVASVLQFVCMTEHGTDVKSQL